MPIIAPTLNLIVLRAEFPHQLCGFYASLGLEFVTEQHGAGPKHYCATLGAVAFEIYPRAKEAASTRGLRIGFNVPSLEAALLAIAGLGSVISDPALISGARRAVVLDPEGHKVEIVEIIDATSQSS